jgi:hypothetical protein
MNSHDVIDTTPAAEFTEVIGAELRVATLKENGFVRGWTTAGDPEVRAIIEATNQRERARCKAALLARFAA